MRTKGETRRIVKDRLAAMRAEDAARKDKLIAECFLSSPEYASARTIFLYLSTPREAGTRLILDRALSDGKQVFLPRVHGEEMLLVPYAAGDPLTVGAFGISEPTGEPSREVPDLAVIPLLAFDRTRARLGKGKGYYDRFLAGHTGRSVALAYAEQETECVPTDLFDRRPDVILTDRERIV